MDYTGLTAHVSRAGRLEAFFLQKPSVGPKSLFFLSSDTKEGEVQLPKINQRHHDACRVFVSL